jgi:hypothetical protein
MDFRGTTYLQAGIELIAISVGFLLYFILVRIIRK